MKKWTLFPYSDSARMSIDAASLFTDVYGIYSAGAVAADGEAQIDEPYLYYMSRYIKVHFPQPPSGDSVAIGVDGGELQSIYPEGGETTQSGDGWTYAAASNILTLENFNRAYYLTGYDPDLAIATNGAVSPPGDEPDQIHVTIADLQAKKLTLVHAVDGDSPGALTNQTAATLSVLGDNTLTDTVSLYDAPLRLQGILSTTIDGGGSLTVRNPGTGGNNEESALEINAVNMIDRDITVSVENATLALYGNHAAFAVVGASSNNFLVEIPAELYGTAMAAEHGASRFQAVSLDQFSFTAVGKSIGRVYYEEGNPRKHLRLYPLPQVATVDPVSVSFDKNAGGGVTLDITYPITSRRCFPDAWRDDIKRGEAFSIICRLKGYHPEHAK